MDRTYVRRLGLPREVAVSTDTSGRPVAVAGRPVEHLRAVRLPPNARPERLSAVGWLETPAGRVLAVGAPRDAGCAERPKPP
jgi:hypothetical protein